MQKRISFLSIVSVFLVFGSTAKAGAPLADQVPGDAVAYVGWAGADSQSVAYQASDLSAFIDHSNLPDVARQYVQMLWQHLDVNVAAGDKEAVASFKKALPLLWQHPTALYVASVTVGEAAKTKGDITMICDAGADAAELRSDLQTAFARSPLTITQRGTIVTAGWIQSDAAGLTMTLSTNPDFISKMQKLQTSPAFAVYVDVTECLTKINQISAAASQDDPEDLWPKVRDALGITNVRTFAMTAGFDGSNWMTSSLLEAPSPRTGLLAAFEPKPIDPALLARIPASAGAVSVYNADVAQLVDTIGNAMAVSPQSDQAFHQVSGLATVVLGSNFRKQIVGPLGPQWVLYSDSQLHSVVLMNHPNDAKAAGDAMESAIFGLVNLANSQIPGATTQPVASVVQSKVNKINVTSAVTRYASPSVAVNDGILYFGLSPDALVAAATLPANQPGSDLLHGESFVATVKRLGVPNYASFQYCDLPDTAPLAYDNFGPAGQQLRQVMSLFGIDVPKIELPPLDQMKEHLSPALSVKWADENGIYSKSISPFPGSVHLLGDPQETMVSAGSISALSAMMVPLVQQRRASALSVQAASQERQILLAMTMYAADHRGQFPPDLGSLASAGYISGANGTIQPKGYTPPGTGLSIFLDPSSNATVPAEIATATRAQQAAWVNDHSDYVLLTPGRKTSDGDPESTVVLIPKNADHATTRVAIGFGDGHVETCTPLRAKHLLHPDAGN